MAQIGEKSGSMPKSESRILRNLFRLGTLEAQDIMTPRTVIASLPHAATVAEMLDRVANRPFSRLPVTEGDKDTISGFVLRTDVLVASAEGKGSILIGDLKREIMTVRDNLPLSELFDKFLQEKQHIAIVLDEYGGTTGLLTLEDIVETLIGIEIIDETDAVVDMRALARERWKERASAMGIQDGMTTTEIRTDPASTK